MSAKTNPVILSKIQFSIIHELIIEKCYQNDLDTPATLPNYVLYGYNDGIDDPKSIRMRIASIMQHLKKIDGRALSKAANDYYSNREISFSQSLFKSCTEFLGVKSLDKMLDNYFVNKKTDKTQYAPPPVLAYLSDKKRGRVAVRHRAKIDAKLENLSNTAWWCYSHFYSIPEDDRYLPQVHCIPFFINSRLANGDYEVELKQEPPYTTFKGRINRSHSGDNILICELTSVGKAFEKRVFMVIHVNLSGDGEIFIGGMIRYTDNASIRLNTFIMEKMPEVPKEASPKLMDFSAETEKSIKSVILDYLYNRHLNVLKLPRNIYNEEDFLRWINPKKKKANRMPPEYDLMVACPIRSLDKARKRSSKLRDDLIKEFETSFKEKAILEDKIDKVLEQNNFTPNDFSMEDIQQKLRQMITNIKSMETKFQRIYCPLTEEKFNLHSGVDASYRLEEQMEKFKNSRALLMIFPFPAVSGVLVEAGWSMFFERKIPLMIVYRNLDDLPLLLRKASTLHSHKIFMASLDETNGISGIANWIVNSKFERFLPNVR